jgi:hypothetical protein
MAGLPYNVRVNVNMPFPTLVAGAAGIKVTKKNGIWTIQPDFSGLSSGVPPQSQYGVSFIEVWNSLTGVYTTVSFSTLQSIAGSLSYTLVTSSGTYTALSSDNILLINRTVPSAGTVQLPLSASRSGFAVVVKDFAGDAGSSSHTTTVLFSGSELCDGLSSVVINSDYGAYKFLPLTSGGWTIIP